MLPRVFSSDICPPDEYFNWSIDDKIDWQIEHYLPALMMWMQQWVTVLDSKRFDILVTRFEDLQANPMDFFVKIFNFYELDVMPVLLGFQKGRYHHRLGLVDEWKTVLSASQIQRMQELIPSSLLEKFGWEPF
ncbi:MAG: hypothetical protein JSS62_06330 [Verrucomicrobia bacterium]|nr:hypothetical protein [Verrucomicrobiota bacterium]MBS0645013.1 hypothetical protein [Verrucomicrobiota bacterium]